jgi:hypothetical protein
VRIQLDQDRVQWGTLVDTIRTFGNQRGGQCIHQLSDYQLFKKVSAPWGRLYFAGIKHLIWNITEVSRKVCRLYNVPKIHTWTNSVEQNPSWAANSRSASQEIPCLLWNTKAHYRVHKSPPLVSIPRQMQTVHTFPTYFPKMHSNIIFPPTPRSSEWSLPFRFSDQNVVLCTWIKFTKK